MSQVRFHIYTFLGSLPWCYVLAYMGMRLGQAWDTDPRFKAVYHRFQLAIEIAIVAGVIWFIWTHWKNRTRVEKAPASLEQ
jgi:membrane protein DedA with SNARE-associated domain